MSLLPEEGSLNKIEESLTPLRDSFQAVMELLLANEDPSLSLYDKETLKDLNVASASPSYDESTDEDTHEFDTNNIEDYAAANHMYLLIDNLVNSAQTQAPNDLEIKVRKVYEFVDLYLNLTADQNPAEVELLILQEIYNLSEELQSFYGKNFNVKSVILRSILNYVYQSNPDSNLIKRYKESKRKYRAKVYRRSAVEFSVEKLVERYSPSIYRNFEKYCSRNNERFEELISFLSQYLQFRQLLEYMYSYETGRSMLSPFLPSECEKVIENLCKSYERTENLKYKLLPQEVFNYLKGLVNSAALGTEGLIFHTKVIEEQNVGLGQNSTFDQDELPIDKGVESLREGSQEGSES